VFRNPQGLEKHLTGHIANLPDFRFGRPSTSLKGNSGVTCLPYRSTATIMPRAASRHSTLVSFGNTLVLENAYAGYWKVQFKRCPASEPPSPARRGCVSAPNIVSLGRRLGVKGHTDSQTTPPERCRSRRRCLYRIPTASPDPEGDRAGHRSRTSPNGMSVIAALHDPLAVLAANDLSDMVRPDDDRPDGWTAGIRSVVSP
jgi:hypothetical protein